MHYFFRHESHNQFICKCALQEFFEIFETFLLCFYLQYAPRVRLKWIHARPVLWTLTRHKWEQAAARLVRLTQPQMERRAPLHQAPAVRLFFGIAPAIYQHLYPKRKFWNIWDVSFLLLPTVCPAGKASSRCLDCPVDTYKEEIGTGSCTPCPNNKTTNGMTGATAASACGKTPFGINLTREQVQKSHQEKTIYFVFDLNFISLEYLFHN